MRDIIRNKLLSPLKVCIFSGLAVMSLTANAEDTPEFAAVPPVDDCHYAEHPLVRETVHHKYRHVTHVTHHHRIHAHRNYHFANDLSVDFPFSSPSYYDNMWPSECPCAESGYVTTQMTSDELTYNLMSYGPPYETSDVAPACDEGSEE